MTLKEATSKMDEAVAAFRLLRDDEPEDYFAIADRHEAASELVDEAQTLGSKLTGADEESFQEMFSTRYAQIERYEAQRLSGVVDDDVDEPDDTEVTDSDEAEEYSSMAAPANEE